MSTGKLFVKNLGIDWINLVHGQKILPIPSSPKKYPVSGILFFDKSPFLSITYVYDVWRKRFSSMIKRGHCIIGLVGRDTSHNWYYQDRHACRSISETIQYSLVL